MAAARFKVGLDTSCIVALLTEDHAFHEATRTEWERLRAQNVQLVVSCHALLESFSVLTRMPPPYYRSPEEADRLLQENFGSDAAIPGVTNQPLAPWHQWQRPDEMRNANSGAGTDLDWLLAGESGLRNGVGVRAIDGGTEEDTAFSLDGASGLTPANALDEVYRQNWSSDEVI